MEHEYWSVADKEILTATTPDDAFVLHYEPLISDDALMPKTMTAHRYRPQNASLNANQVLERVLQELDEEYGNPEDYGDDPTDKMLEAAQEFCQAVIAEYELWMYERTGEIKTVNTKEWAAGYWPEWKF